MRNKYYLSLGAIASALLFVSCMQELKEINPAYDPEYTGGDINSVEFVIPAFVDDESEVQTKTTLTSAGFVWAEKDTVGIFPSKGNQIYYEMSSGAGSSHAVFDGGGWALKDDYRYSSYYPLQGDFYLQRTSIPITYSMEVTQSGNDNSDHLGSNAFMFAPETTVSDGKVTFKYWQLGSVLKPRVTLPAGTYTKLVLSTEEPIFVVSGKYDLTTGVDASSPSATKPDAVPEVVPDEDNLGVKSLTNRLTINLENVTFTTSTELVAYIMAAPVDVSNIPINVTIYSGDSPMYRYEFVRTSGFSAQTTHNIRPNDKGLMLAANTSEGANAAFSSGGTSLSLVGVPEDASFDLVLPATADPVSIYMDADEGSCAMSVSYPDGSTVPGELHLQASDGSNIVINTPESTVTLSGERSYETVRAATASNTLIIDENVTIGTLYLEKGNVYVYGEIMALNTDDLEEGETPTIYVYGTIQGQIDDDDVDVRLPITAVTLDQTTLDLVPGESVQLVATTVPENAICGDAVWTSSDTSVATVSSTGLVTAVSEGTATITATWVDDSNIKATCTVTVEQRSASPEYVDLGLPSGLKWATFNVGATKPEEYGGYYQWAGTEDVTSTSINLNWSRCPYQTGSSSTSGWTKYVLSKNSSYWSGGGNPDNKLVLDPEDDVARSWGGKWRMPTDDEWTELRTNCGWEWTDNYNGTGVAGRIVTGSNGNSIFLPAAGCRYVTILYEAGSLGYYWSSSLGSGSSDYAWVVYFYSGGVYRYDDYRYYGRSVRPVYGDYIVATAISLNESTLSLLEEETSQLSVSYTPEYCSVKGITWTSSDTSVATVSSTGLVTAVSEGTATITATWVGDSSIKATCEVTVNKAATVTTGTINGHDWVQLWENGPKWATTNVGATKPEEYGAYYQWAGTEDVTSKSISLNWSRCPYHTGSYFNSGWTKYVLSNDTSYWSGEGNPDNKLVLDPEDDVARSWGGKWRMPTDDERTELRTNCDWEWTNNYNGTGVAGMIVTGSNGNSIFLPAAGYRIDTYLYDAGWYGGYWSSSLSSNGSYGAWGVFFDSDEVYGGSSDRCYGRSVRPVSE